MTTSGAPSSGSSRTPRTDGAWRSDSAEAASTPSSPTATNSAAAAASAATASTDRSASESGNLRLRFPALGHWGHGVHGVASTVTDLDSAEAAAHYCRYSDVARDLVSARLQQRVPTLGGESDADGKGSARAGDGRGDDHNADNVDAEDASERTERNAAVRFFTCGLEAHEAGVDSEPTPQCFAFRNQEMRSVKPMFLPWVVALVLFVVGAVITGVGGYLLQQDGGAPLVTSMRYDDKCSLGDATCDVRITVPQSLRAPVYVWYELSNFYSNYRRYDQSRSARMHQGEWPLSFNEVKDCKPLLYGGVMSPNNPKGYLVPCGLLQGSQFNDTLRLCSTPGTAPSTCTFFDQLGSAVWNEQQAAWESDRNVLYANGTVNPPFNSSVNARINSGDYIVWQRISSGPRFLRLYRVLHDDLAAGTYAMRISNVFNSYLYGGTKSVVVGKVHSYGFRNRVLSIAYIVTGPLCLLCCFAVLLRYATSRRKVADPNHVILKELMDELDESKLRGASTR